MERNEEKKEMLLLPELPPLVVTVSQILKPGQKDPDVEDVDWHILEPYVEYFVTLDAEQKKVSFTKSPGKDNVCAVICYKSLDKVSVSQGPTANSSLYVQLADHAPHKIPKNRFLIGQTEFEVAKNGVNEVRFSFKGLRLTKKGIEEVKGEYLEDGKGKPMKVSRKGQRRFIVKGHEVDKELDEVFDDSMMSKQDHAIVEFREDKEGNTTFFLLDGLNLNGSYVYVDEQTADIGLDYHNDLHISPQFSVRFSFAPGMQSLAAAVGSLLSSALHKSVKDFSGRLDVSPAKLVPGVYECDNIADLFMRNRKALGGLYPRAHDLARAIEKNVLSSNPVFVLEPADIRIPSLIRVRIMGEFAAMQLQRAIKSPGRVFSPAKTDGELACVYASMPVKKRMTDRAVKYVIGLSDVPARILSKIAYANKPGASGEAARKPVLIEIRRLCNIKVDATYGYEKLDTLKAREKLCENAKTKDAVVGEDGKYTPAAEYLSVIHHAFFELHATKLYITYEAENEDDMKAALEHAYTFFDTKPESVKCYPYQLWDTQKENFFINNKSLVKNLVAPKLSEPDMLLLAVMKYQWICNCAFSPSDMPSVVAAVGDPFKTYKALHDLLYADGAKIANNKRTRTASIAFICNNYPIQIECPTEQQLEFSLCELPDAIESFRSDGSFRGLVLLFRRITTSLDVCIKEWELRYTNQYWDKKIPLLSAAYCCLAVFIDVLLYDVIANR